MTQNASEIDIKLAIVGHSLIHPRQQAFFKEVSRQGAEVLMISPGQWGNLRTVASKGTGWELKTCRHMGGDNVYDYQLLGAEDIVKEFKPDWLYVQSEPGSFLANQAVLWEASRKALFTWENISIKGNSDILEYYDLIICGNPEAEALVKPYNDNTALLLQVGVDTDHFQARPDVPRDVRVAYIGRKTPEKGLPYLLQAWPTAMISNWVDYRELPWRYSQAQVVVGYSQDVPFWKEQAPNYTILESLSCRCRGVVSDTAAMAYWLKDCPAVVIVEGHEQPDGDLRANRVVALREGIQKALDMPIGEEGRLWIKERFGSEVMARNLLEVLR